MDPNSDLFAQLAQLGVIDEQGNIMDQQLAQAAQLRKPSGFQGTTGGAAALGGLADLGNNIAGIVQTNRLRSQQQDNLKKESGIFSGIANMLRRGRGGPAGAQAAMGAPTSAANPAEQAFYAQPDPASAANPAEVAFYGPKRGGPQPPFPAGGPLSF